MSFKEEFLSNIRNSQAQRFENAWNRPMIEVWPDDDAIGLCRMRIRRGGSCA